MLLDALITKGQALFFLIAMSCFGVLMIVLYRKDRKRDPNYFRGTWKIFAAIILIVSILFLFVMSQS
jgi:glucan phosphoethanolaminetransferase (alkaline phosphatase superfamily)